MNTEKAKRFIEVWQKSHSVEEAAKQLKMSPEKASSKATAYRAKGVPLKKMNRAGMDWKALAEYARKVK